MELSSNNSSASSATTVCKAHTSCNEWKIGVKLGFLVSWSRSLEISRYSTTTEVCELHVKPATQASQLSYCEQLLLSEETAEFIGKPSAFISHAWSFKFLDVLEALTTFFRDEVDVIVWFDIFSVNQHQIQLLDFDWWDVTFKQAIASFGRTVMVMAPWNDPIPLHRGWCVWELYCTIERKRSEKGCKFDVAMSPSSIEQFIADIDRDPYDVVNKMLATINTEKSDCWKREDRERIHDAIRRTVGFNELNKEIFGIMRSWIIAKYEENLKLQAGTEEMKILATKNNLARLYASLGEYSKSMLLYEECIAKRQALYGDCHPDTLSSMNNLAALSMNQGEYAKALPLYLECLEKNKVVLGEDHRFTLLSMNNLAVLYKNQGEYSKALSLHEECFEKKKVSLGDHPSTLSSMSNLAGLYASQGEYSKALSLYEECIAKRKALLGDNHLSTLASINNLAGLFYDDGKYSKALPLFEECLTKRKTLLGDNHPSTLSSIDNLSACRRALENR